MNEFLKTRYEVDAATKYLEYNNFVQSGLSCKNYEIAKVIPYLTDGDILDMGSSGSVVLDNAVRLGLKGKKMGIDLAYTEVQRFCDDGVILFYGDLMASPFLDKSFDIVTCLSVVEHDVKFDKIAKEVGRLLRSGGNAFISFDFWNPKPLYEKRKLYNLDWNILDRNDVENLVEQFALNGLNLTSEIDWTTQDAVINSSFCSPVVGVEYTFGILHFIKK